MDGEFTQQDWEKMKWIMNDPNIDPTLKKDMQMYEQMMLLPQKTQDESDRRWHILVEGEEKIPEAEKPRTMGAHRDLLLKYGFKVAPVPKNEEGTEGNFNDFMRAYGARGMQMVEDYEMKGVPDAKPRCGECKKEAGLKCKQCKENYCSRECQRKAWPGHKKLCQMVAEERGTKLRFE